MFYVNLCKNLRLISTVCSRNFSITKRHAICRRSERFKYCIVFSNSTANYRSITDYSREWAELNNAKFNQAFISFKYLRLIKAAIREFGPIPEENEKLANLIECARKHNLPDDFLDFAMKISVDVRTKAGIFEMQFPSGGHFIIQYEDIDNSPTKHHLLELSERSDTNLIQGEIKWPKYFEQKGIILVREEADGSFKSMKEAEAAALQTGAEVIKQIDEEGCAYWRFCCNPSALHKVKWHLMKGNHQIEEAYVGYIPKNKITLSNHLKNVACDILTELNKIPTIDNVYDNIM